METNQIEQILEVILCSNEPEDIILAIKNELNNNPKHFGSFVDEGEMDELISLLKKAANQARFILHGE